MQQRYEKEQQLLVQLEEVVKLCWAECMAQKARRKAEEKTREKAERKRVIEEKKKKRRMMEYFQLLQIKDLRTRELDRKLYTRLSTLYTNT